MKLMDLLQEKLEKKIGDEWIGKDGLNYEIRSIGLIVKEGGKWRDFPIGYIDEHLENIKEIWLPIKREFYYYIDIGSRNQNEAGEIVVAGSPYIGSIGDEGRIKQGNYFKTREEAEQKLEKILGVLNETN